MTVEQGEVPPSSGERRKSTPAGAGALESPAGAMVTLLDGKSITRETATIDQRRQIVMVFQRPALLSCLGERCLWPASARQPDGHAHIERALAASRCRFVMPARTRFPAARCARRRGPRAGALPKVLFDEPRANLDPTNVRIIEELIREQHETGDTTIVLVTHNIFQRGGSHSRGLSDERRTRRSCANRAVLQ